MNKIYLVVSLCVLMTVSSAYAAPVGSFYAGISAGKLELDSEDFPEFDDTSFKLFGGYQLNSLVAVEGYYTKLDDKQNVLVGELKGEGTAFGVSAKFTPVRGSKIIPFGKIGVNKLDAEVKLNGVEIADGDETELSLGIGLETQVTKNIALRAEYERFDKDFTMLSAGVAVNF